MSPAWPTVKLVSVPADAPSVFELSEDGVEASCVICVKSSEMGSGVVAPLPGATLRETVPPDNTLPAPLNVMVLPPMTVDGAVAVGVIVHVLDADLVKVKVKGIALP